MPSALLQSIRETYLGKLDSRREVEEQLGSNIGCRNAPSRSEHDPPGEMGEQRQRK